MNRIHWMGLTMWLMVSFSYASTPMELADGLKIRFVVKDQQSNELIFKGEEDITIKDDLVTKETFYYDLQGALVQKELSVYSYSSLAMFNYAFENRETGEKVQFEAADDLAKIQAKTRDEGQISGNATVGEGVYLAKPLHHLIVRNWSEISSGENFEFGLLVPSKMDSYEFRIRQLNTENKEGKKLHRLRLEPTSWIARRFVKPMDFLYDGDRVLHRYEGVTTAAVEGDANRLVTIDFSYEQPSSR